MKKGRKGGKGMKSSEDGNLMSIDRGERREEEDFISLRMITAQGTLYDLR